MQTSNILFTKNFVNLTLAQSRMKSAQTRQWIENVDNGARKIMPLLILINVSACAMPLAMLGVPTRTGMFGMALIHYVLLAFLISLFGNLIIVRLVTPVVRARARAQCLACALTS